MPDRYIQEKYSVALCTYNGEKYIEEQLRSIIGQSVRPAEIIICDDGSTDSTLQIAKEFLKKNDISYRIDRNNKHKGVAENFQSAISKCRNDIIFTCDQDDVWLPEKAKVMLDCFSSNNTTMLVFSDGVLVDSRLISLGSSIWENRKISSLEMDETEWFDILLNRFVVTGATMALRKHMLFNEEEIIPEGWLHDGWLAFKASINNGLMPCNQKLILYRQHDRNVVGMRKKSIPILVNAYINQAKKMNELHIQRYTRYKEAKQVLYESMNSIQRVKMQSCVDFWGSLVKSDNTNSKIKRIVIVISNWWKGNYRKYINGYRGVIEDLLFIMLR